MTKEDCVTLIKWFQIVLTVLFLKSTGHHSYLTKKRRENKMMKREMMMKMMMARPQSMDLQGFISDKK